MQLQDRKIFKNGRLNTDDDAIYLEQNDWLNLQDFRVGSIDTDQGRVDVLNFIGSTILKPNANLPDVSLGGQNIVIGAASDIPRDRIVYIVFNSNSSSGVFCYDKHDDVVYTVALEAQITGGLNLDKNHPVHSSFVENGCYYWTDNLNQLRRVNIDAGIKMNQPGYVTPVLPYTAPLDQTVISLIRRQPGLPPTQTKVTQIAPPVTNNFIAKDPTQYAYRYIYRDFEKSRQSAYSTIANFNGPLDQYNRIDVAIPTQEQIDQDVVQIDLIVRYLISGQHFIINSWTSTTDAAAIAAHNAGVTPLSYSFYNDKIGQAIDSTYAATQFDSVANKAPTIETAKNRSFVGGGVYGYDTPTAVASSLVGVPFTDTASSAVTGRWFFFKFQSQCGSSVTTTSIYLLDIVNVQSNAGYYIYLPGGVPPFPASVAYAQCQFRGAGLSDVMNSYASGCFNTILQFTDQSATSAISGAPAPPSLIGKRCFKTDAPYLLATHFMDAWGRRCGVITSPALKVQIPDRTYNQVSYTTAINWTLSNANAINEIPDWAAYFSVDISKCLRTRFFMQAHCKVSYAKLNTDGTYDFTPTTYDPTFQGIAIDISLLLSQGMGYVWESGTSDVLKLWTSAGQEFFLSIIGQQNQYLICQLQSVNIVAGFHALFEIYTPYQPTSEEPEWEVGQIFPVSNPGTASRAYSITAGQIFGDVTLLSRTDPDTPQYLTENMSPNDTFYKLWFTDSGRPNYIDTIGQKELTDNVAWSNTFINQTKINGLSTFDALDVKDIGADYGPIQKLILTSKMRLQGSIMLAVCSGSSTASLYLGENLLTATTGEQQVTQSSDVIGFVNPLKGSYGTVDPTSVIEFRGDVYWYDRKNSKIIQYSNNGLFPISNYKMTRYWKLFTNAFENLTSSQIESLGGRPYIVTGIDPHHGELLVTVPQTLSSPVNVPVGYSPPLPSFGDYWDGDGKTNIYKIEATPNKWVGSARIKAEWWAYLQDDAYAFKDGNIYLCNSPAAPFANYFGVQYSPFVSIAGNANPTKPKLWNNIALTAFDIPSFTYLQTDYPFGQNTDIPNFQWVNKDGVWYGQIMRDRLTPSFAGDYDAALFSGDRLKSQSVIAALQFDATQQAGWVKLLNLAYTVSVGHVSA